MITVNHVRVRAGEKFLDFLEEFHFPAKAKPNDKVSLMVDGIVEEFVIETLPEMTGKRFVCVCRPDDPFLHAS